MDPLPPLGVYVLPVGQGNQAATYEFGAGHRPAADIEALYGLLTRSAADSQTRDQTHLVIWARSNVRWQFVIEAYNLALRAKFKNVTIQPAS